MLIKQELRGQCGHENSPLNFLRIFEEDIMRLEISLVVGESLPLFYPKSKWQNENPAPKYLLSLKSSEDITCNLKVSRKRRPCVTLRNLNDRIISSLFNYFTELVV